MQLATIQEPRRSQLSAWTNVEVRPPETADATESPVPKRKVRLTVWLPPYPEPKTTKISARPGMTWRRAVYAAIMKAASDHGVEEYEGVDLECEVMVYLSRTKMHFHDVDNLQKHIFGRGLSPAHAEFHTAVPVRR
jgi:hypothetical protein